MTIKIYQVDAFAEDSFSGNPAAVCPLDAWLSDELMQQIAMENNLAETAFYVKNGDKYDIRWFTPTVEVDLCGHATLASAYVLFNKENYQSDRIEFYSHRSGNLSVRQNGDMLTLNFPRDIYAPIELSQEILAAFETIPQLAFMGKTDLMLVFQNESEIRNLKPNLAVIAKLDFRGLIATAAGDNVDFVSRFFGPQSGIDEDPATGSSHTTLIPYWSEILNKKELTAIQLSARKGYIQGKNLGERVEISGKAKLYLEGNIYI
ncbi:MAG: PhzF family phenazine biosynthesis protein [Saprospiraceae bacterium]